MTTQPVDLAPLTSDALRTEPRLTAEVAPATHPLVLLPVRLETRFRTEPSGAGELLVRIYPDQVHIDAHDPRLTDPEVAAGQEYWRAHWRTGANTARQQRLWAALAQRFRPGRAAWLVRATRPENPAQRPAAEVADDSPPAAEPVFGPVETVEQLRTPVARLLPDRWTATAYRAGSVVAVATGGPVTADLAVGPDLDAPLVAAEDDERPVVDAGMNWLVDFDAAEAAGMGLRLPVTGGVDLLLVSGVRLADPSAGAAAVADLLAAQRYTEGLAVLEPEVPSNNADEAASGWSSAAAGDAAADPAAAAPGSAGDLVTAALGLTDATLLGSVAGVDSADDALAAAMATALWPATWGYWLTQFGGADAAAEAWLGEHAARFVRPGGPLPVLRVGRQPYGLLPVTSLQRFAGDGRQDRLRGVLVGLRDAGWRPVSGRALRVAGGDVAAELVDVLRLEGRSHQVSLRRAFGARFADNAARFLGRDLAGAGFWTTAANRVRPLVNASRVNLPVGALTVHEPASRPVTLPLVGSDPGALAALLASDADSLARTDPPQPSLLAVLVRHGLLRRFAAEAARLLAIPARDAELYGFGDPDLGWAAQRGAALPDGGTVAQRIDDGDALAGYRTAVETLAGADAAALERHLLGTLDAASHRLDAWVTSLAGARLAELRSTAPTGLLVGGYGWVEALAPAAASQAASLPEGEPGPLLTATDDPGYLHAPSLHQAQVAALLRTAHLSHGGGEQDPFAVSLTSERVRLARWIFDGVRAGRSLGTGLGYLVERDLHERGLDASVDNAREVAPLPGQEELPIAARRLDGLRLHELWRVSEDHAVDHLVGGSPSDSERGRAVAVLRALGVAVDAAADALQAEQVHQFAMGDLTRAVNTVGDIDRGLAPPPELDFQQTPRGGVGVTHRVAVLLDPTAPRTPGWAVDSLRATAEPVLDAGLGRLLGPAGAQAVTVASGSDLATLSLDRLDLAASDLVRIAGAGAAGEVELAFRAASAAGLAAEGATLVPDRELGNLLELGRLLAALVTAATPLDGVALQPPHADPRRGVDLAELDARLAAARAAVTAVVAGLDAALASADPIALRAAVADGWPLGLDEGAFPVGDSAAAWSAAAARVQAALQGRLAEADAVADDDTDPARARLARLRALLGPGFVALPRFLPPAAGELVASRNDPALTAGDPLAVEQWFTRMERVREPLRRAGIALRAAEALGGPAFAPAAAQVPHRPGATWNALPASGYVDGAASLVLFGADALDTAGPVAGLLVDEWSEVVPSAEQTTGLAFAYDAPEAMAPHAVLLAVPPVAGEAWTQGALNQVLVETLELAHLRAVPPSELGAVRQFLPASVLAFNAAGDAVSTDPAHLSPAEA